MFNIMKKKFSKFLMFLAVTAGMGVAVTSCKDTDDDLQNQIDELRRTIYGEDLNLYEGLDRRIGNLDNLLGQLKEKVDLINSCECDMTPLWEQLGELQDLLDHKIDSLGTAAQDSLDAEVEILNKTIGTLRSFLINNYVSNELFKQAKDSIYDAIEKARCKCDMDSVWRRFIAVEKVASDAYALAVEADTAANRAQRAANQAQSTADLALEKANKAQATADSAKVAAGKAQITADSALHLGDRAYRLAEIANLAAQVSDSIARKALALAKADSVRIDKIEDKLVTMSDSLKTAYETAASALAKAEANELRINKLDSTMTVVEKKIFNLTHRVDSLEGDYNTFKGGYQEFKEWTEFKIDSLSKLNHLTKEQVEAIIDERVAIMKTQIATNTHNIDSIFTLIDSIFEQTEALTLADGRLNERIDSLAKVTKATEAVDQRQQEQIDSICTEILKTQDKVQALEDTLKNFVTHDEFNTEVGRLDDRIDDANDRIDATNIRIDSLALAYQLADELLQDQIDDLSRRIDALEGANNEITKKLDEIDGLKERIEKVETTLQNMITGIIVQGTYNPAFGSVNLPANLNSNILIAFYGDAKEDIYFPTNRTGNYVHSYQALTEKDMEMIGAGDEPIFSAGDKLLSNEDSNAGTLYVTINPNTVDFTGEILTLENSQAKESGIKLGELKKSDKVLEFGYTRAADNGFYEAPAYVEADKIDDVQKVNFNTALIKSDVKDILKNRQNANFAGIAGDIYDIIAQTKLDANAVKATWTDGNDAQHNVYSNYALAATAVKPLSLETMKDFDLQNVEAYSSIYDRISDFIDDVAGRIKGTIDGTGIFQGMRELQEKGLAINIQKATLIDVDKVKEMANMAIEYVIDKKWTVGGQTYYFQDYLDGLLFYVDDDGNSHTVSVDPSASITLEEETITMRQIIDMKLQMALDYAIGYGVGEVNRVDDEQNTMIITITDFLGDVCDFMNDVYDLKADFIDKNIDRMVSKLKEILDNGNRYLSKFANGIHYRLQPILVTSTDDGSHRISTSKNAPSKVASSVTFMPTSWTIELIVPFCKKHVAITNVFKGEASAQDGDADCKSALEEANEAEGMNEVLDGNTRQIKVDNLKSGYTYEVAYSALDFHGKIATKKYYFTVK